ncbi:hypothetical protein [Ruminiclostridium josui]|uniref:hypothetical protein n=1 Tax=Ruminiclostridium josui TaxID=1499 RepID=UPI001331B215|nr:hypothetical protein [Ruminiclostridium josui]
MKISSSKFNFKFFLSGKVKVTSLTKRRSNTVELQMLILERYSPMFPEVNL